MGFGSWYDEAAQEVASRRRLSTYSPLPVDKATSYYILFTTAIVHSSCYITNTNGHR